MVNSTPQIKRIVSTADLQKAFAIRLRVFVREQRVPASIELDRYDAKAVHFLAVVSGKAVGTARVVLHQSSAKIGRMAVLKTYRRRGVGIKLLKRAIATAQRLGAENIYLHAQVAVIGFYERFGFCGTGTVFDEAGIAHRKMIWRKTGGGRQRTIRKPAVKHKR